MSSPTQPPAPAAAIVVLAAGSGSRVGAEVNKVLLPVGGRPLLAWSVGTALEVSGVAHVVVVCRPGERGQVAQALSGWVGDREVLLIDGGPTRQASEQAALDLLAPQIRNGSVDVVAIHDGARPLAPVTLYDAVVAAARAHGGAVPAHDLPGLVDRGHAGAAHGGLRLVGVQTPQAFRAEALLDAYAAAADAGFDGTDTAAAFAEFSPLGPAAVRAVPSTARNLKVTFAEDVVVAERLLGGGGLSTVGR